MMNAFNRIVSFLLVVVIYGCSQSLIVNTNIPSPLVNQVDNIRVLVNYDENIINYSACRVSWASCVTPPTCGGDGYCPEIAMSSYIIIYY